VPALFAVTLFVSAGLLFLIQPMVGKMVLPLLGGSPAVWNTCMVFFQALLLLGYLYAHKLSGLNTTRRQVAVHLGVLAFAVFMLAAGVLFTPNRSAVPVFSFLAPEGGGFPFFNVVLILTVAVGVPFFAIATSAPLLQRWFAGTGHPSAKDPYFLYAASNAGSLLSLVGYPLVTEPSLRVVEQTWVFAAGFVILFVLIALCGWAAMNPLKPPSLIGPADYEPGTPEIPQSRKLRWLILAFVPSSLMLGVTTHLTTDIASIPLLWVVPLALYLLTFIVAFARGSHRLIPLLGNLAPVTTLLLVFTITSAIGLSVFLQIVLHLLAFFFLALLMHTELAAARPDPRHLTTFYIWMSLGGVAGGVFNSLIAPVAFPQVIEYSVAIVVGCLLLPRGEKQPSGGEPDPRAGIRLMVDLMIPFVMILICMGLKMFENMPASWSLSTWLSNNMNRFASYCDIALRIDRETVRSFLVYAPACLLSFFFIDRPLRFGLAVLAILFIHHFTSSVSRSILETKRSYFGVLQIRDEQHKYWEGDQSIDVSFRVLSHGTTIHGRQFTQDVPGTLYGSKSEPLTYYHRTGPVGDLVRDTERLHPDMHVGVVGLGTGSVAAYAGAGQAITFYEIDPLVVRMVEPPNQFTYLHDAKQRGAEVKLEMGDARLTLARHTDRKYHLLLIDAFSSDAIPIHLMTVEAVKMYLDRLTDDGLLAFHVSNRYLRLEPVVAALAKECGLTCRVRSDECEDTIGNRIIPKPGVPPGRTSCTWIVLSKSADRLAPAFTASSDEPKAAVFGGASYAASPPWAALNPVAGVDAWTDDYASVPQVIRSNEFQWFRRKLGFTIPDLEW
jgi:hypothetical protein